MDLARNKILLLPLLAVLTYPLWQPPVARFLAPRESEIVFSKKTTSTDARKLHLSDITLSQSRGDKLEMVLKADSVATGEAKSADYHFTAIACQIYDEQGLPTRIKGGEALLASDKNLITIVENVEVVSGDGTFQIKTDALRYFIDYQVAKTATPVVVITEGRVVYGNSMMYNLRTNAFRVGGGVVVEM
jgi:LPS export ABC transporter protein LptC